MSIDPDFQSHRPSTEYGNLKIWKEAAGGYGIYGTEVAVDFDLCVGDGACIEVCPVNVFDWHGSDAERKALPSRERDCIHCFGCEAVCPKFAIRISVPKESSP